MGRNLLVVLVVGDEVLRGMLAGRLVGSGVNLLTADSFDHDLIERRHIRRPSVLVIDEVGIAGDHGRWIEAQWLQGQWQRVVVLTADPPLIAGSSDWLIYVERNSAAAALAELFAHRDRINHYEADLRPRRVHSGTASGRLGRA